MRVLWVVEFAMAYTQQWAPALETFGERSAARKYAAKWRRLGYVVRVRKYIPAE